MDGTAGFLAGTPDATAAADPGTAPLLRRVVESLPLTRRGRYTVYLGRPDPVEVRAEWEQELELMRSAKRAIVITPETTPVAADAERRDPSLGWLSRYWFSAVLGQETAMALICEPAPREARRAWLLTEPQAVRRFIGSVEAELARPDPELLAV